MFITFQSLKERNSDLLSSKRREVTLTREAMWTKNKCRDHLLLFWEQQIPFTLEEKINRITIAENQGLLGKQYNWTFCWDVLISPVKSFVGAQRGYFLWGIPTFVPKGVGKFNGLSWPYLSHTLTVNDFNLQLPVNWLLKLYLYDIWLVICALRIPLKTTKALLSILRITERAHTQFHLFHLRYWWKPYYKLVFQHYKPYISIYKPLFEKY